MFRKLGRHDQRFKKDLEVAHNNYYKKLFKEKWTIYELESDIPNDALNKNKMYGHYRCKSAQDIQVDDYVTKGYLPKSCFKEEENEKDK